MKKIIISLFLVSVITLAPAKSYVQLLKEINNFLVDFDNGYYGHLEIRNGILYDYYKNDTHSNITISDYSEARVVEEGKKVAIYCNSGSCVTGYNGSMYDNMPFSSDVEFDADDFVDQLNALVAAYKDDGSQTTSDNGSDFPVGKKVRVIEAVDNTSYVGSVGTVSGSSLRPFRDGWFMGSIKMKDGTVITFRKVKVVVE